MTAAPQARARRLGRSRRRTNVADIGKRLREAALALLLLPALAAFQPAPRIGPNGDGTLRAADDQRWLTLQGAEITADPVKGEYHARFGAVLRKLDGQPVRLSGYMLPVEVGASARHLVITRRSAGCPFCAPPGLTEAVEVFLTAPVRYSTDPVAVEGRFRLVSTSDTGLFYRLEAASAS